MIKVNEADQNMALYSKNVLNDKDRQGEFCLPKIGKYVLNIDSCHKFTDNKQDHDLVIIDLNIFNFNANLIWQSFQALLGYALAMKRKCIDDVFDLSCFFVFILIAFILR